MGLPLEQDDSDVRTDSLAAMLIDVRQKAQRPLTEELLFAWQAALFPTGYSRLHQIRVGQYRGPEPMRIVSGPIGKETGSLYGPAEKSTSEGNESISRLGEWGQ